MSKQPGETRTEVTSGGIEIKGLGGSVQKVLDIDNEEHKKAEAEQRLLALDTEIKKLEADIDKKQLSEAEYIQRNELKKAKTVRKNLTKLEANLKEKTATREKLQENILKGKEEIAVDDIAKKEVFGITIRTLEEVKKMSAYKFLDEKQAVIDKLEDLRKTDGADKLSADEIKELNKDYKALREYEKLLAEYDKNITKDVFDKGKNKDATEPKPIDPEKIKVREPYVREALGIEEPEKTEEEQKWQGLEEYVDEFYANHDFLNVTDIVNLKLNIKHCDLLKSLSVNKLAFVPTFKDSLYNKLEKYNLDVKNQDNVIKLLNLERLRLGALADKLNIKLKEARQKEAMKKQVNPEAKKVNHKKIVLVAGEEAELLDDERMETDIEDDDNRERVKKIQNLIINTPAGAGGKGKQNMAINPDQRPPVDAERSTDNEKNTSQFFGEEYKNDPISREMREDENDQVKRIETASGVTFELDKETVKSLKNEITKVIDLQMEELAKEYLSENDPEGQDLEGSYAIQRVKELGKLDELRNGNEEIKNLYALRVDLGGKRENTLVPLESRRLILAVLNNKSEKTSEDIKAAQKAGNAQEEAKKTKENEDLFVLREKLTEKIIGKSFNEKLLADGKFDGREDFIDKEIISRLGFQEVIINSLDEYLQAYEDGHLNEGIIKDFVQKNKGKLEEHQKFISGNLKEKNKTDALKKRGIADNYSLACIKKAGYEIIYKKAKFPKFLRGGEEFYLQKGDETVEINSADDLNEIKEKAEEAWGADFLGEVNEKWGEEVRKIKEEGIESLGSENADNIDNLYRKLKERLLEEDFYKNIKTKSPEQMAKIKEAFGGNEKVVKDYIADASDIMDDLSDGDDITDADIGQINLFRERNGVPKITPEQRSSMGKPKSKKNEESWVQWLVGLDFPIKRGKGRRRGGR